MPTFKIPPRITNLTTQMSVVERIREGAGFQTKIYEAVEPDCFVLTSHLRGKKSLKITTKKDLEAYLKTLKDKDGKNRFDPFDSGIIVSSADTPEKAQLAGKLAEITDKDGKNRFDPFDIEIIVPSADTPEKAQFKFDLAEKLTGIIGKEGNASFAGSEIGYILSSADTPEKAIFKFDLTEKLAQLEDKNDNARLTSYDMIRIVFSADTPKEAQFKFDLAEKLAQLEDKNGNARLAGSDIREIVFSADTPEKAQLAGKLAQLEDKNGNARLSAFDINEMVSSADTPEQAQFKAEYAYNKGFLAKIDALDTTIGNKLYAETLKSGMTIDFERMNKLYNFLKENKMNLQQYGQKSITNETIINLFGSSMLNTTDLLDDGVIKYAIDLKYDRFKKFIRHVSELKTEDYSKLKENLSKLNRPKQKMARLQSIIDLKQGNFKSDVIQEAINLIKPTKTTKGQINLADGIFTSEKSYPDQIQEFLEKFNVSQLKREKIIEFLTKNKLNEQIRVDAQTGQKTLKNTAKQALAQQIEVHINVLNNDIEFNNFINSQIYKKINIKPTPELLKVLNFDEQYLSNLFSALSNSKFSNEFTKLIELIKSNPSKPLSELRETLKHNQSTKTLFEQNGLNYEKWTKFDKNSHHVFSFETDLEEAIRSIEQNIVDELNGNLFKSVDKVQTDKILRALSDEGYNIDSASITKNRTLVNQKDLEEIVGIFKKVINANADFWDKPLADTEKENLKNELINHLLKGRKKEVSDLASMANAKMDLQLRLSDVDDVGRNLFIGNHVSCCTSVDGSNGFAAPQRLINSFMRMMEIVDKSGNSYGKSMCYFAKVDNKLSFIIDCFEANGKLGGNQAVTDAILDYAKQLTKEMAKSDDLADIPIYLGPSYNKINMSKLKLTKNHTIKIIGNVDKKTYAVAIGGRGDVNIVHSDRDLYT